MGRLMSKFMYSCLFSTHFTDWAISSLPPSVGSVSELRCCTHWTDFFTGPIPTGKEWNITKGQALLTDQVLKSCKQTSQVTHRNVNVSKMSSSLHLLTFSLTKKLGGVWFSGRTFASQDPALTAPEKRT